MSSFLCRVFLMTYIFNFIYKKIQFQSIVRLADYYSGPTFFGVFHQKFKLGAHCNGYVML